MKTSIFGKTGETVSRLGFGCMRLPTLSPSDPSSIDEKLATAMVRKAIDRGVNYVDTAYPYHRNGDLATPGESEPFLGRCLKDGYREKVKIATKLPTWLVEREAEMHKILDAQLKRLGVGHIDFYLAHNLNASVWPKMRNVGLLYFLNQARKDGRIKHAGFSFHDNYALFEDIVGAYDWSFAQIQYNYLDVDFQAGRRGLELLAARGLGVVVMEPLRGGFLIHHMPAEMKAHLAGIRPDWSLADWGLRWLWSRPEINVVLSGMSNLPQTSENLGIADKAEPLSAKENAALDTVRGYFRERTRINCTGCGYCMPCPSGVNIPKVLAIYNDYFMVDTEANHQRAKAIYRVQVREHEAARHCVACAQCEGHCPQSLPISQEMSNAAEVFQG